MDCRLKNNNNNNTNNDWDFFSYIHFEETGDSEAINYCDHNPIMGHESTTTHVDDDVDDNDDALSCSYDGSACDELIVNAAGYDDYQDINIIDDHDQKEEDVVYGTSYCEEDDDDDDEEQQKKMLHEQNHQLHKCFVSSKTFDLGQDSMDEMEKNRLFWEACLAS